MHYFRLIDDLKIFSRWYLGEVMEAGRERVDLRSGNSVVVTAPLSVETIQGGRPLDFCLSAFAVPIATQALADAIAPAAASDLQRLPVDVAGHAAYEVLNCTRAIPCLDEGRSKFMKWEAGSHRADLLGQYRMVTELVIDVGVVPPNAHFFRIAGWRIALIVSEIVKDAMEAQGCLGALFLPVTR
jgi:hypothetical protein